MTGKQSGSQTYISQPITRRQAIKAGGIAAVGFAFSKPAIDTLFPKPAFAQYVTTQSLPSFEWQCPVGVPPSGSLQVICDPLGDDLIVNVSGQPSSVKVTGLLCDVSALPPGAAPYDVDISPVLPPKKDDGPHYVDVDIAGQGNNATISIDSDGQCKGVTFEFSLFGFGSDTKKVQVEFDTISVGRTPPINARLVITLEPI